MTRIILIGAIAGMLLGCFIGQVAGETFTAEQVWSGEAAEILAKREPLSKSEFIKTLIEECKGDIECRIPYKTAQFYSLNPKMRKDEELLVTGVGEGQVDFKVVDSQDKTITEQEFWRRSLEAQEK